MGLFSTTLHLYEKDQAEVINSLKDVLSEKQLLTLNRIEILPGNFQNVLESNVFSNVGVYYLITEKYDKWITIIEVNVNITNAFYLYELGSSLSSKLNTYALSFHLHDDDVLYYNLDYNGESLDGYNSNVQYFEHERLSKDEVISQRHDATPFSKILPGNKSIEGLNQILDRGYWQAFDNDDLDKDGTPNGDRYDTVEEDRLKEIGSYLEIYSNDDFPYANWYEDIQKSDVAKCYLLKATK